jgi:hypothetical protein
VRTIWPGALLLLGAAQDPWAADWAEAARRAREERKLVVVPVELFGGLKIPDHLPLLFTDPDLDALLRERFVGLRWKRGMKAPFQDPAVWGMGPMTFGIGILFADPEGRIVGQCPALSAPLVEAAARAVLAKRPEAAGPPLPELKDVLDTAEALLRRGEFARAAPLLERATSPRALRLKASMLRRERRGEEALAALRQAREGGGPEPDLLAEEAAVLTGLGRFEAAEKACAAILENHAESARAPEAKFSLGHLRARTDAAAAKAALEELARDFPGSRWGRLAAQALASGRMAEARLAWPTEKALEVVREVPPLPLPAFRLEAVERDAAALLLRSQLPDGSWATYAQLTSRAPAFAAAATAICASALLPFAERKEVALALDRALAFLLELQGEGALAREAGTYGFGYGVWGRAFAVRFLARCLRAKVGDRARVEKALAGWVEELRKTQARSGGWGYYAGAEMSFATAAVILSLLEAKVEGEMVGRALDFLSGTRLAPGRFGYGTGSRAATAEASLRAPLGELALLRGGRGGAVRAGLDFYLEHAAHTRKERGKVLCHTGPEGTAPYYLLFGYAYAAEALGELRADARTRYRDALVEDVLAARLEDGGFLDFPPVGRFCGTGLALAALSRLRE